MSCCALKRCYNQYKIEKQIIIDLLYRFGSWGICFTYGTWFAIEGLSAVGQSYGNSTRIRKACKFLLSKQLCNGGWGESHLSSRTKVIICGMLCYIYGL